MLVVIGTDCIGSYKSKYHTITTITAPITPYEKFVYTKVVIKSHKSQKDRQWYGQRNWMNKQTMIYEILHRKVQTEQHESY
jgi:hypothetical protein